MDKAQLLQGQIFSGKYTAQTSKLYHQAMSWRFGVFDRVIRATVGLLAIASFATSLLAFPSAPIPVTHSTVFFFSLASMAAAVVLNIVPVGDYFKRYDELYRQWNAHSNRWETLDNRFQMNENRELAECLREINELTTEKSNIQANEPAPWRTLLGKCQDRVNLMFYDKGNPLGNSQSENGQSASGQD